jgi:hypothetical protein
LLTCQYSYNATRNVTRWNSVNRYGYIATSLFVPYALANLIAIITVVLGMLSFLRDGTFPDKTFQDIANAASHPHIVPIICDSRAGFTAQNETDTSSGRT